MWKKLRYIPVLLCFICANTYAQLGVEHLNFISQIDSSHVNFNDNVKNHSSILPRISTNYSVSNNNKLTVHQKFSNKNLLHIYPITNLSTGLEVGNKSANTFLYKAGIGAGIDFHSTKFFISGKLLPYVTQSRFVADSVQATVKMDANGNRLLNSTGYIQPELLMAYRPNKIFTFMAGNGRNFFGEGYRSLILSDNAAANPFLKIETAFSNIKYVNLYQMWKDNTVDPTNKSLDLRKFAAMHYISWNITREFNLSIFETVIWQSNDTLINRGFDINYLNPVVFYRPVEYGSGSADNVLLGANMSFKFNKTHSIYTQIVLDDFLIKEIRARSRWWANKYGFQIGYKSLSFLNKEDLYFQLEFNTVRPFTYSHKSSSQSYGHLNASVAHPIGANFFEILNITSYKKGKFRFTNKITYSSYGVDSSAVSYGQNIFIPYGNRVGEYDHFIMQGFKKNVLNETFIVETPIPNLHNIHLNLTYNWRMENTPIGFQNNHSLMIGIRSRIWNRYTDF